MTFVDALIYGVYFTSLLYCIRWVVFTDEGWKLRSKKDIKWVMLVATMFLFAFSITNEALVLWDTMVLFRAIQRGTGTGLQKPAWITLVVCTTSNLSILIGDLIMIQRCWLICNKSRRIVAFPILLWIGGVLLTALQAYWQIVQEQHIIGAWQPVNSTVGPGTILTPFWGSTLVLNAYTSSFIIYRIWKVAKSSSKDGTSTSQIRFVMRILIESGVLYFSTTLAHFVVWWTTNAFAINIIASMNIQLIDINFNLIFIRTSQQRAEEESAAHFDDLNISGLQFAENNGTTPETATIGSSTNDRYKKSNAGTVFVSV